jgi:uncharacterized repeat protein (TIGR01451 family)
VNAAPNSIGTMELLSDGSVMAQAGGTNTWYKLTPDAGGSYVNGAWSQIANMNLGRLYYATNVLQDGRVFVLGGEYSGPNLTANWTNAAEIYDPVTNAWTVIPSYPESGFGDSPSMLLADGRVIAGSSNNPNTNIYDPATNAWSPGPTKLYNDRSDEETWVKLPDGSILSYDVTRNVDHAQRLDPSTMTWVDSGQSPVGLVSGSEVGGAVLLPDGRVLEIGGTSNTTLYTPPDTPDGTGTWEAGPVIPSSMGAVDAPVAMMPNGHALLAVGPSPGYNSPTKLFEYDPMAPVEASLTDVTPTTPNLSSTLPYVTRMLVLPSGQVLFTYNSSQLYVYTPSGVSQSAWKPVISGIAANGNNYVLSGMQLNGISAGASYGDDAEMDTNYPIIQLKAKDGSERVYFARTFNWSSTGVATGSSQVTTNFSLPPSMPFGTYALSVVANGIASDPVDFSGGFNGTGADLAVSFVGPASGTEGYTSTYNVTVRNLGPSNATGVVLTDTLGASLKYVSATKSQGTVVQSGGVITFTLGSIAAGQSATATITVQALEEGNLANNFAVTSSSFDMNQVNDRATAVTAMSEPAIMLSGPINVNGKKVNNQAVATFAHANGVEAASAFVATINWGDGTSSPGAITLSGTTYTVKGSHNYASGGSHTVTTTVVEANGEAPTASPQMLSALVFSLLASSTADAHANASGILSSALHANSTDKASGSNADPALVDIVIAELTSPAKRSFSDLSLAGDFLASLEAAAAQASQTLISPDKSLLEEDELFQALMTM